MGRPRLFDTDAVLRASREAFVRGGYAGTSIDDLLRATGLLRASLYSAFGSKRGLFVAVLLRSANEPAGDLNLLLVALMDLTNDDTEVRDIANGILEHLEDAPEILGRQILHRAGLLPVLEEGQRP